MSHAVTTQTVKLGDGDDAIIKSAADWISDRQLLSEADVKIADSIITLLNKNNSSPSMTDPQIRVSGEMLRKYADSVEASPRADNPKGFPERVRALADKIAPIV